ncbi:MAG: KEOPS complex subunit Cgi121 [Halobacteriaceae archaeon]
MRVVEATVRVDDLDALVEDLRAVGDRHGVVVQAVDATLVADRDHLAAACEGAARAIDRGEAVARDPSIELLLYAAGRRQIDRAMEMGLSTGETPAAVVVDAATARAADPEAAGDEAAAAEAVRALDRVHPEPTLDRTDETAVRDFFDVSEAELAATDAGLAALVRERVALLDVEK